MGEIADEILQHPSQFMITGRISQRESDVFYIDSIEIYYSLSEEKQITDHQKESFYQIQETIPLKEHTYLQQMNLSQHQSQGNSGQSMRKLKKRYRLACEYPKEIQSTDNVITDNVTTNNVTTNNVTTNNVTINNVTTNNVTIGSFVVLKGEFSLYPAATNPGEFDLKVYYDSLGVVGKLKEVRVLQVFGEGSSIKETLFQWKQYFEKRLYRVFPPKEAGIMSALLLGDKTGLDMEIKDLYKRSGIIHILSISGLHISLIGMGIYELFRKIRVPIPLAAIGGSLLLVLYGIMTGMSISATRAILMYLIKMLSLLVGRTYDMATALMVAAALMMMGNGGLITHGGFLLSFGSVMGICLCLPILSEGKPKWLQILLPGLSITLFTLPIQLWFYFQISVWSVFLNLCVIPCMSALVVCGLVAMLLPGSGILGTVDSVLLFLFEKLCLGVETIPFHTWNPGQPKLWRVAVYYGILGLVLAIENSKHKQRDLSNPALLAYQRKSKETLNENHQANELDTKQYIKRLRISNNKPYKEQNGKPNNKQYIGQNGKPSNSHYIGQNGKPNNSHYIGQNGKPSNKYIYRFKEKMIERLHLRFSTICQWMLLICAIAILGNLGAKQSKIAFLDVGQGDCACVQTKKGQNFIIDCGSSSRKSIGEKVLIPYLQQQGIHRIHGIFISHGDKDHVNGIEELLVLAKKQNIRIDYLFLPPRSYFEEESFESICSAVEEYETWQNLEVEFLHQGRMVSFEDGSMLCLNPPEENSGWEGNEGSLCLYLQLADCSSVLFAADVEGEGEENLVHALKSSGIKEVSILKVAHHGSEYATGKEFLEPLEIQYGVISCGRNNRYGHPHEETLERLEENGVQVLRTDEQGAIIFILSSSGEVQGGGREREPKAGFVGL